MKIAVVTETFWPEINGVAMTLHRLVAGLAEDGHCVQLICPAHPSRDMSKLPENVCYYPVRGLAVPDYKQATYGLPAGGKLLQFWLASKPDVIYVATEGPLGWSAVRAAGKARIAVISGFHTNFQTYCRHYNIGFLAPLIERYLVSFHNRTLATVVPTDTQKSVLHGMGIENVTVMGRGVDTTLFSPSRRDPELRKQWGADRDDPVMIYVGRIAEEKNLSATLHAYHAMRIHHPKLKFVLVGEGPLRDKLQLRHPELIMAGMRTGTDLAAHYASGDIFAFSSLSEAFGNVILEAMASGLGVVAFDYAAARLHLTSGVNGLLAEFNDTDGFVAHAVNLVRNELLLRKIRNDAVGHALQHNWQAIVDQFLEILHRHTQRHQLRHEQRNSASGTGALRA